ILIKGHGLSYIVGGGIGYSFAIDAVGNTSVIKGFFKTSGQPQLSYTCIGDDQNFAAFFLLNDFRQGFHTVDDFRLSIGQERQCYFQSCLKGPAVYFFKMIHGNRSFLARKHCASLLFYQKNISSWGEVCQLETPSG